MGKIKFAFTLEEVIMIKRAIMTEYIRLEEKCNFNKLHQLEGKMKEYDRLYDLFSTELGKALEGK